MKLQIVLLLILILTGLLSSCAEAPAPYTAEDARTLLDSGAFEEGLAEVSGPAIPLLYGIDDGELVECVSFRAVNTAVSADEVTVLILTDEDAAERAEQACRSHIDSELENARAYTPSAVPALESAIVKRVGASVLVAVGDPDKVGDAVDALRS